MPKWQILGARLFLHRYYLSEAMLQEKPRIKNNPGLSEVNFVGSMAIDARLQPQSRIPSC
jgi:hypothetical protein